MDPPNCRSWNTIIRALSESDDQNDDDPFQALVLFRLILVDELVEPNRFTFPSVLKACAQSGRVEEGKQVHGMVVKIGLEDDEFVLSNLVRMYVMCGAMEYAHVLFNSNKVNVERKTQMGVSDIFGYQQEGIKWLAFLKRFNLHGVLCDDMGLGKTLQASAIVASDIAEHRASNGGDDDLPSLIVCPSTLVGHWVFEIEKFIDTSVITTLQYVGSAQERSSLRTMFAKHNVIVTSYDVVRKDIDHLRQLLWNFCILDEGHMIKNSKSKITGAVKQLKAQHRLILSGTPIQFEIASVVEYGNANI
ncbi:hypothetical protein RJ640_004929 [Escallonia rubra]|uniref:Helicase ATP-binding domain-containing protein n=1 Tax=Escallonia rubra TaxID=112253 RepID=A0AA88UMM7_9ASTE|nr:hypothetical protein RJ640_004929 [Escallonia rubra]